MEPYDVLIKKYKQLQLTERDLDNTMIARSKRLASHRNDCDVNETIEDQLVHDYESARNSLEYARTRLTRLRVEIARHIRWKYERALHEASKLPASAERTLTEMRLAGHIQNAGAEAERLLNNGL